MDNNFNELDLDEEFFDDNRSVCMYYTVNHFNSFSSGECLGNQFLIKYSIRSFNTNGVNFVSFLRSLDITPKFLILSETWNNTDSSALCNIEIFFGIHTCRTQTKSGGISVFFRDDIVCS